MIIQNLAQELTYYEDEAARVTRWIDESKRSLIPESPLELASAIIDCVEIRLKDNNKFDAYIPFIKSLRDRVEEAYVNISRAVTA